METVVKPASASQLDAAGNTLAVAFENYPWTRHVLPEDDYTNRLRQLQRLYLGYAHTHGIVVVTENCDGVIALLPPDPPAPDPEMLERAIALHGDRASRVGQPPHTPEAWRLETIGVRPEKRGRGLASALINFALSEVTAIGGREVVLETSDERNVRLYERHGFTIVSKRVAAEAPPVWSMSAYFPKASKRNRLS